MERWNQIIQAGVTPIIVISACGLLALAFYNRMAAVVARLRAFHREQLQAQDMQSKACADNDDIALVRCQEVRGMLSVQIAHVTRRARVLRGALACLLLSVAMMAACSIAAGVATLEPRLAYAAAPLFVHGLLLLIGAAGLAMLELKYAVDPVELESQFIEQLDADLNLPVAASSIPTASADTTDVNWSPAVRRGKRPCRGDCHSHRCAGE
jgi:hypothetical protein